MLALKIFIGIASFYGAFKLSGVAIAWMKEVFERMKPPKRNKNDYNIIEDLED